MGLDLEEKVDINVKPLLQKLDKKHIAVGFDVK